MNISATNKYITNLLFILITISESTSAQKTYFQGELVYEIKYESHVEQISETYLRNNYGSKVVVLFKNGNYVKRYYSPDNDLLSERFLKLKSNISYQVPVNSDTAYYFSIRQEDSKATIHHVKDTIVNDHPCVFMQIKTQVGGPSFIEKNMTFYGDYYYSKELLVNPNWYQHYSEGNFNDIIKIGKGVKYKSVSNTAIWHTETTLTSYQKRKIKNKEIKMQSLCGRSLKKL